MNLNLQLSKSVGGSNWKAAERAIKAMADKASKDETFVFDSENPDQVRAYMQLRLTHQRITPLQFKKTLQSSKSEVTHAGAMRCTYWGVPKSNFPNGLPDMIKQNELPDDQAKDYMIMGGGSIDTDVYYLIDCVVPRTELGRNVVSFEFVSKNTTKTKLSGASAAAPSPSISLAKALEADRTWATVDAAAAGEAVASASAADRTRLGRSAGAGADQDADKTKDPKAGADQDADKTKHPKKEGEGRSLARYGSEVSDELAQPEKQAKTMANTLKVLKEDLYRAMDAEVWEAASVLQRNNVKDLVGELIQVLLDMKPLKPAAEVSSLATKVAHWLINQILGRPMFKALHIFKQPCAIKRLIEGELAEGIDRSANPDSFSFDMVKLIESLAETLTEKIAMPDLTSASVTHRTTFRNSLLFQSFVNATVDDRLAKAKEASGKARMDLVKECQHLTGLPEAVQYTIDVVIALFDEDTSLVGRIAYMLDQSAEDRPKILKCAISWDPNGVIGMAAMSLEEKADMTGQPYLVFEQFADAAIKTVGGNMMCALSV